MDTKAQCSFTLLYCTLKHHPFIYSFIHLFIHFPSDVVVPDNLFDDKRIAAVLVKLLDSCENVRLQTKSGPDIQEIHASRVIVPCVGNSTQEMKAAIGKAKTGSYNALDWLVD